MKPLIFAALAALAVSSPALAQANSVNLDQFDGRWFEIARSPNDVQKDCRRAQIDFNPQSQANRYSIAVTCTRRADGVVETLAGTGRPGTPREGSGKASELPMNQPWDVVGNLDRIYIAMAGANQVWEFELGQARLKLTAGSGELGIADGPAHGAMFAHPAALAQVQQTLYIADAASSAIRSLQITQGQVQTLVGQGLYEFGDEDGQRREARLQYPLAIALDPASPVLWIADSYNGSLRRLRLGGGDVSTHALPQPLEQPAALATAPGSLWIANSGAHEVLRYDLGTGKLGRLPIGE